ncbi:hypothetical protein L596_016613 [Steinernema carpocapsae]|uniref:Uncharacterized protein n=1 Tax=Steinernema carpocapsae TaxID=34508 RepID=A0A4V6A3F7_STECR|nr:hypothetical protein L596_016613 [Steinernema carpocapsae]
MLSKPTSLDCLNSENDHLQTWQRLDSFEHHFQTAACRISQSTDPSCLKTQNDYLQRQMTRHPRRPNTRARSTV